MKLPKWLSWIPHNHVWKNCNCTRCSKTNHQLDKDCICLVCNKTFHKEKWQHYWVHLDSIKYDTGDSGNWLAYDAEQHSFLYCTRCQKELTKSKPNGMVHYC